LNLKNLYFEQAEQVVEHAEVGLAQVPFELQQGPVPLELGQVPEQVEQAEVGPQAPSEQMQVLEQVMD
jgi:hypothetical protein